jgi:AAHS family 4-hydroxybenzoate transporter-like MFS transporter
MLPESKPLQLPQFVDERPVSPFQYVVIILCGLVMLLDDFDTQAISYMLAKDCGFSIKEYRLKHLKGF